MINSYEFKFIFTSCAFPTGQSVLKRNLIGSFKSNRKLINFLSNELINLRKGIGAIFYQHFYCIDSKTLEYIISTEFAKVYDWLQANKLTMNFKKSNFVMFYPYQKKLNHQISIRIFDKKVGNYFLLERKEYLKYLGVLLDEHLTWKHHIDYVASKISKSWNY